MFATIIVPLDGSPDAEAAVPVAWAEACAHGATLVLLRVVLRPEPCAKPSRGPLPPPLACAPHELADEEREAAAYLRDVQRRWALPPATRREVAVGEPVPRLLAVAHHQPAPLVVLTAGDAAPGPHLSEVPRRLLAMGDVPVLAVCASAPAGQRDWRDLPVHQVGSVITAAGIGQNERVAGP